jgi:toxin ParE1/3/4
MDTMRIVLKETETKSYVKLKYISTESINIAIEKYELIKKTTNALKKYLEKECIIQELYIQKIKKYKDLIVKPWRIMYERDQKIVYINAITYLRRNIEDILMRRNLR